MLELIMRTANIMKTPSVIFSIFITSALFTCYYTHHTHIYQDFRKKLTYSHRHFTVKQEKEKLMITIPATTVDWLCNSETPRIRFMARTLFGMQTDRSDLYDDSLVKRLLTSLEDWETEVLKQHNKPDLGMHRLCLLADMGVRAEDEEMKPVIERILGTFGTDGLPRFNILLPKVFKGSGEIEEVWTICDYPQLLYSLMKMGVAGYPN